MPKTPSDGAGGGKVSKDGRYGERLLNASRGGTGQTELKEDSVVGPKTMKAIEELQRSKTVFHDDRVDPDGPTVKALEQQIACLSREMKVYLAVAITLSYDPYSEEPRVNSSQLAAVMNSMFVERG